MKDRHVVLGTAGHIDHGKTRLTQALTGVNTDRLKEEQKRQISIEPGYAPLVLPSGMKVSIVDVPGHERLIRQMVSGVSGIDFVFLIVAADDGVMPQTKEHLAILDLLGIQDGLIILSKMDRADPDLLPIIEEDLRETTKGTFLQDAPILKASAVTGEGIDSIRRTLDQQLPLIKKRKSDAPFRLPIDRSFTIKGAGTVVTGTVQSGSAAPGDELQIVPGEHRVKVRQAQNHGKGVPTVYAGQRAALNVTGVEAHRLHRGQTVIRPGAWNTTERIDIRVRSISELTFSIRQRSALKLLIGTAEVFADLILYDRKEWKPGEEIYATLALHQPVVAARGDRLILRRPTPAATVGGGEVVEPRAPKRKIHPSVTEAIRQSYTSTPAERMLRILRDHLLLDGEQLAQHLDISTEKVAEELKDLQTKEKVFPIGSAFASAESLDALAQKTLRWLTDVHQRYPMRDGAPKAEWISRFLPSVGAKESNALLSFFEERRQIRVSGETIALFHFAPAIPDRWQKPVAQIVDRIQEEGFTPTEWNRLLQEAHIPPDPGEEIKGFLTRQGILVPLTQKLLIHRDAFDKAVAEVKSAIDQKGALSMPEAKKLFALSRKYLVPLLERMDQEGITRRQGNQRVRA